MSNDTYITIKSQAEGLYKEKGSKFLAFAVPVKSEDDVKTFIASLRKDYHDARHHCYAYALGYKGEQWRANDDGEPSGTAGKPIHGQLISRNLTNTLVVVIRYFGGTKLGVSGLINAYRTAASEALDNAEKVEKTINNIYRISFAYIAMNDIMKLIKDLNLPINDQLFDNGCWINTAVRQSECERFLDRIEKIDSASAEFICTD